MIMHTCTLTYIHTTYDYTDTYWHTYIYTYIYSQLTTNTYVHTPEHTYNIHTHIPSYKHAHIYTYTIYDNTHITMYTNTYTSIDKRHLEHFFSCATIHNRQQGTNTGSKSSKSGFEIRFLDPQPNANAQIRGCLIVFLFDVMRTTLWLLKVNANAYNDVLPRSNIIVILPTYIHTYTHINTHRYIHAYMLYIHDKTHINLNINAHIHKCTHAITHKRTYMHT